MDKPTTEGDIDSSCQALRAELQGGGSGTATELVERYTDRLLAVARRKLAGPVQRKIDPEDILQSVFRCFFERVARNQYTWPNEPSLWGLLLRLTQSKCGRQRRYFQAARRDIRREQEPAPEAGRLAPRR